MTIRTSVLLALVGVFVVGGAACSTDETMTETMTLTGTVGDAMCGVKHMMSDSVACTLGCVTKGADYALIVNDKAYTLNTSSDEIKGELEELAGKMAMITGDVQDDVVTVASVVAAQ